MENNNPRAGEGGGVFIHSAVMALLYLLVILFYFYN